jgi:hypothetical protein
VWIWSEDDAVDGDRGRVGFASMSSCRGVLRRRAVKIGGAIEVDAANLNERRPRGFATGENGEQYDVVTSSSSS